jgi:hypothetical protein
MIEAITARFGPIDVLEYAPSGLGLLTRAAPVRDADAASFESPSTCCSTATARRRRHRRLPGRAERAALDGKPTDATPAPGLTQGVYRQRPHRAGQTSESARRSRSRVDLNPPAGLAWTRERCFPGKEQHGPVAAASPDRERRGSGEPLDRGPGRRVDSRARICSRASGAPVARAQAHARLPGLAAAQQAQPRGQQPLSSTSA